MAITVERWAGFDIQDATYRALLEMDSGPFARTSQQVQVQPPGSWARHIRVNHAPRAVQLLVEVISGDVNTAQRQLSQWFAPGAEGDLEILEDGVSKVLGAVCVAFQRYAGSATHFVATLIAADPRWRSVTGISAVGTLTASGQTWTATNAGNSNVDDAVITFRPTTNKAAANGYLYKLEVIIAWLAELSSGYYALELTEGWNHAAEVTAVRSQADGDDVRVLVDGVEVARWFGENAATDANSATTNVWANLSYSPRRTATLLAAVTATVPGAGGELEVSKGGTIGWPRQGALRVDDEVITYTGRTESNASGNAAFTGVARGQRDTTAAIHSAAAACYWVEHRVQIVYGNTGVTAPDPRPDLKPLLDLTSATVSNLRHEWLNFADATYPGRSMQWGRRIRTNEDQFSKILAPSGSPAANMTLEYQSGGAVSSKPNYNTWYRDFPTGTGDSGGNVASVTRALADTLGMWAYGIDGDGREIVLEKYAGAIASGSDSIAEPTNPVYRIEFWGFNQVLARRPDGPDYTAASWPPNTSATDNGQQFLSGSEPVEIVGAVLRMTDATGGRTVSLALRADNGADVPASASLGTDATYVTTAAGDQFAVFTFAAPVSLQPNTRFWITFRDATGGPTETWDIGYVPYGGGKRRQAGASVLDSSFEFKLIGRPGVLATSFDRFDAQSFADNGDTIVIDGVTVHLDAAGVPYVALKARVGIYRFANGTLFNDTTAQSIRINAICALAADLRIDIGAGTAVNLNDENLTSIAAGVEYSDPELKFTLAPGANTLRFTETGLVAVTATVTGLSAWE